jgi:uncharacterized RDD family membrane protein YckC
MNAFNRLVMIVIALLLIVIPVALILVAVGAIAPELVNQYTGYSTAMDSLGNLSISEFDNSRTRAIMAIAGALLVIISLLLLLRELTLGRRVASNTVVSDEPGAETLVTARAVRALAEGAAREEGALSPSASLLSEGRPYTVFCKVQAPAHDNYGDLAARVRQNIRRVLEGQNVPIEDVEVTVEGTSSQASPQTTSQQRGG